MKKKRKMWTAVCAVCIVLCIICIAFVVRHYILLHKDANSYEQLTEEARGTEEPGETEEASQPAVSEDTTVYVDIPIDFAAICAENKEIYAWITVPGTLVDYPVLQSATDDLYYLDHGLDGQESVSGCIYSESVNAKDFTDPQTVLYGHNMKNDTMFGSLHSFEDRSFFDANRVIYVYTPEEKLTYQIFAAYPWSNEHLLNTYDTKDPQVFAAYLDQVKSVRGMNAFVDETLEVDENDCVLTLSTCIGNDSSSRYLVQGVLISREPGRTKEGN